MACSNQLVCNARIGDCKEVLGLVKQSVMVVRVGRFGVENVHVMRIALGALDEDDTEPEPRHHLEVE